MVVQAKVYWNFHRKCFSVQVGGRVVAHATRVTLASVRFRVSEAGRQRVLRDKRKNVHAYVTGDLASDIAVDDVYEQGFAKYNPYVNTMFVTDSQPSRGIAVASTVTCFVDAHGKGRVFYVRARETRWS